MRKIIIPLIVISLFAFGCVLNFDDNESVSEAPRPLKPQSPAADEVVEQIIPSEEAPMPPADAKPLEETQFAASNNAFAYDIYKQASEDKPEKNIFFSPYSIYTALGMAFAGAKRDTEEQMQKALYFNPDPMSQHSSFMTMSEQLNGIGKRGKAELSVANGLFQAKAYEQLLLAEYQQILKKFYASELYSLDFEDAEGSANYINDWVLEHTNKRIKDLVNEQHIRSSNNGMVLVNAIFFKANWLKQFNPKNTDILDFYPHPEKSIPVNMMHAKDYYAYAELQDMQVIELPYDEEELSMLVFLPKDKGGKIPNIDDKILDQAINSLKKQEVRLWLPRFTLELELGGIPKMLQNMGMTDAFSETYADFTGIRDPKAGADLFIKDILHKAFIEVNEEGTEAAAATSIIMATKASAVPEEMPIIFNADHPFLYMILHKPSQSILFMGKLSDPPKA